MDASRKSCKRKNFNMNNNSIADPSNLNSDAMAHPKAKKSKPNEPMIFKITSPQLSNFKEVTESPVGTVSLLNAQHYWSRENNWNCEKKISSDGRMVYLLQPKILVIIDLFLNSFAILKNCEKSSWDLMDFVVLDANTILTLCIKCLPNSYKTGLQRVNFFVEENRFECQTIHEWGEMDSPKVLILSNIIDESTMQPAILLSLNSNKIMIGRIEENQYILDSIDPFPRHYKLDRFSRYTFDGTFLQVYNDFYLKMHVFDSKNRTWCRGHPTEIRSEIKGPILAFYRTKRFLYVWKISSCVLKTKTKNKEIVLHRLDLETKKWSQMVFDQMPATISSISTIKDASGEERGISIFCTLYFEHPNEPSQPYLKNIVKRLMYKPDPLATLCWLKIQQLFTDYNGKNVFEALRKLGPLKKMFTPIYKSMKPIEKLSV